MSRSEDDSLPRPESIDSRTDAETTVAELRKIVEEFVCERRWEIHHAPKNLSMALAIEAAELMEHFQWLTIDQSRETAADQAAKHAAGEEVADCLCYILAIANALELDLSQAMRDKMKKNIAKYPPPGQEP